MMRPNEIEGRSAKERANAADSMWAKIKELQRQAAVSGWVPPADLEQMR